MRRWDEEAKVESLYCTLLYHTVLYYTILYYTAVTVLY